MTCPKELTGQYSRSYYTSYILQLRLNLLFHNEVLFSDMVLVLDFPLNTA